MFSIMQNINQGRTAPEVWAVRWKLAVSQINFCVRLALHQVHQGGVFVYEQPLTAKSWGLPSVRRVQAMRGVLTIDVDMCMFGLSIVDGSFLRSLRAS